MRIGPGAAVWVGLACGLVLPACRRPPSQPRPAARAAHDAAAVPAAPPRGILLALVYTSNLLGEYERCGCPVHPLGGLGRRAAEVDRARADSDGLLQVDAGDLLLPAAPAGAGRAAPSAGERERRARLLAQAYARLGVDAFTPGERDLALGVARLRRVLADARVPAVSANLVDPRGTRLFAADRLVTVAGVKVGVFGVTSPTTAPPDAWKAWGARALDPLAASRAEIASLRSRGARLIIALLHVGTLADAKRLLAQAPGVDWAVLGHSGMNLESPDEVGAARLLEAQSLGRNLGRLDLHVVEGPPGAAAPLAFADRGARSQLETILADHERQVADYRGRLPSTAAQPTLRAYYDQRLQQLGAAIERERQRLTVMPSRPTGSWFENRIIPLDTALPDQPGVALLVAAYNRARDRRAATAGAAPTGKLGPLAYAGADACAGCHQSAVRFWRATKHAAALRTLEALHRDRSPACVGCHVTGYLQPGGTADLEVATSRLRDVGCEACHGPGTAHLTAVDKKGSISRAVAETVCLGCHTPDQTNDGFDYRAFLGAVVGPGHGS